MNVRANLRYLRIVLRHKWYVLRFGWGTVPLWRLIIHDLSKFSPSEWPAYVHRFALGRAGKEDKSQDTTAFADAWRHHWQHNPHHWEYWQGTNIHNATARKRWQVIKSRGQVDSYDCPLDVWEMPETYVREMIADWKAASKAYSGKDNVWPWYEKTRGRQVMHPETRALVERILKREITERKRDHMRKTGERICMVRDCDGKLDKHPEQLWQYVCRECGTVQRRENVLSLRQADRANADTLAHR